MKKNKRQNIVLVGIAVFIIGGIIVYNYHIDQVKIKGLSFGSELQQIQDDVKKFQTNFESKITQWKEGDLNNEEILEYFQTHISQMEILIPRYDKLIPPEPFISSVKLFKLSTETQLESDKEYGKWIETGERAYKIRSDSLIQESFEYELAALAEYQGAKLGNNP